MVFGPRSELPRHSSHGVRRMDYLETGLRDHSKRVSGSHRASVHGAISKGRDHIDLVRAWAILIVISPSVGAAVAAFTPRGR
jgi:hypothetical protein